MVRLIVLALILANGVYFAWSQGLLRDYGFAPTSQSEPQRLAQQLHPEMLTVLSATDLKRIEQQVQADLAPKECLRAGPFDDAQAAALRNVLEGALPAGSWQLDTVTLPARWIIYMGKFANTDAMAKKKAELAAMRLKTEPLNNPSLELGLSLGGFETQASAGAELQRLNQRGIRTARVVQEREESRTTQLKLPAVNESLKARVADIKPALLGHPLKSCS
ncbi:SPOR domain-containing protein [Rhodoferax aquaticus]|uniref:SPOR domain-containing protein n=1 Tax=Rhodoferax aquaticus TaxID=2527691 RepID=A0A515EJP0_9BURK|nr:SPOR domain-containing protein [Rhodoferax aquaticus]QDL52866.1 SPOR domain-containing protein [Rhodoferax aquaticus]